MHYSKTTLALLVLPTALALPSTGHGHSHDHLHGGQGYEAYKSGHHKSGHSSAPYASDTSKAPYGLINATASAAGTGTGAGSSTQYNTVTIQSTIYQTAQGGGSSAPVESATAAGSGSCGSTSTVTYNPTTTVFVTAGGAPAQSSASAVGSSVAPVSSVPVVSSPAPAPVSSAPVVSSPAPAPVSSTKPVPTQAPSSTVAPLPTSSAVPTQAASSTAATAPSVTPPANAADYCQDVTPTSATVINPWTGANYTGGQAGQKKGIVFVAGIPEADALTQMTLTNSGVIHWLGNYYSGPPKGWPSPLSSAKVEFIPQMYGLQSTNDWSRNADSAVKQGAKNFLSFGEPGTPNAQLYQTPDGAAQFFMDQMQTYTKQGVTIGAPGCLGGPQDWQWDQAFLCKCQTLGCDIGFIAGHWFDAAAPLDQQVARAKGTIETYIAVARGKPVYMDNIWAKGTADEQIAFINELVPWLEQQSAVVRYGWVPQDASTGNGFTNAQGGVTNIAQAFLSAH